MNLYEHTMIARQDTSPSELKQLPEKYSKIVETNDGEVIKTENWGLLNLSYLIKKNKKGSYIHFKIKGKGNVINELERNEAIDKKLLRYLTIRVKKFNLQTNFFSKKDYNEKNVKKDNLLVGINSSGIHSNGFSLINNLINKKFLSLNKMINNQNISSEIYYDKIPISNNLKIFLKFFQV